MSLRDFYMERVNLSNGRVRGRMEGCYVIVRQNGRTFVEFDEDTHENMEEAEIREIARLHGKSIMERGEGIGLSDWRFDVPVVAQVCTCCNGNLYLDSAYDVICPECEGEGVVQSADLSKLAPALREYVQKYAQAMAEVEAERAAEFRKGR